MPKQNYTMVSTMEVYTFAPGRPRQETKQQKRERLRNKKRKSNHVYTPVPKRPPWLLLPTSVTKGFEFWIATMKGDSFLEKKATLLKDIKKWEESIQPVLGFDTSLTVRFNAQYIEKAKLVLELLYQNQHLRWLFKRFFTKVRIQRFQRCNDVDPITLEAIVEPIQFPSFCQRKIYRFEAKPFLKQVHTQLVQSDGQIPDPQPMKNPLTNEVFTTTQIMSLIKQAKQHGYSSWAIEAFCSSRYDLTSYLLIYSKPLRLHAIRTTMADVGTWDSIDTLYDFIKSQHALHDAVFCMSIYKWSVHHAPKEPRIEKWRKMCLKWYEVDITIDDIDAKHIMFRCIEAKTKRLCDRPLELTALRMKKAKSPASTDGSSSV